jgi:LPXTG-motif cell wall-anchored protein
VSIVNRRNAVLGWGVWKLGKRAAKRKAKGAAPTVEGGRPNKPLLAVGLAGLAGALTFWRKKKSGESST